MLGADFVRDGVPGMKQHLGYVVGSRTILLNDREQATPQARTRRMLLNKCDASRGSFILELESHEVVQQPRFISQHIANKKQLTKELRESSEGRATNN